MKICTLKWVISDLLPKYVSQVKKEEPFVEHQIILHHKFLSQKVTVIKSMSGVLVSLCTHLFTVGHLLNRKMSKRLIRKSSLQFLLSLKVLLSHKISKIWLSAHYKKTLQSVPQSKNSNNTNFSKKQV